MKSGPLLFCFLMIYVSSLEGQMDSATQASIIKSLSEFRSELLKDTQSVIAYGVVVHENAKLNWDSINDRHTYYFNDEILYNFQEYNRRKLANLYGKNNILTQMNIDIQKVKSANRYLVSANYFGLVENAYPFNINKKLTLLKELEFYNIQKGDTIYDFSTGIICFAPLLCSIYPNLTIYQFAPWLHDHEIKENSLINYFDCFKDSSRIVIIDTDLRFRKNNIPQYKKVFFNWPIGYSDTPLKVLKNTNNILRKDGYLFFTQYKRWLHNEIEQPKFFPREKLIKLTSKAGLKIISELQLDSKVIYKCVKAETN